MTRFATRSGSRIKRIAALLIAAFCVSLGLVATQSAAATGPAHAVMMSARATPDTALESPNWSGYAVSTGPYTKATGTFTVPYITTAASCDEELSEWVGIDGLNDSSLIQAGIGESMTNPDTDVCTPGTFYLWPWWEILPAPSTMIVTWNDGTTAAVHAGDQVTVTTSQVSGMTWAIELADDTSGRSFTTEQTYNAADSSADWIMEAPYDPTICGGSCSLAPYCVLSGGQCSGPVPFSDLGIIGAEATLWQIVMVQENVHVSTPSALANDSFTVEYTGGTKSTFAGTGSTRSSVLREGNQPHKLASPIYYKRSCPRETLAGTILSGLGLPTAVPRS